MRAVLWVPGRFSLTNKMLDNLRAGSRYQGARPPRGWVNAFEQETQAIRLAVKAYVHKQQLERGEAGQRCAVEFAVMGHHKHDPDAWYLLGKAALDGLVDAGVIGSDRHEVWSTAGRVMQTDLEEHGVRERCGAVLWDVVPMRQPGLVVGFAWQWCDPKGYPMVRCGHA